MQKRAAKVIPGMTQLLSKRPDMFTRGVWPGYYSRAKGVKVWDLDGNEYVDMSISGIGANILGYADPDVDKAVKQAIARGTSCSLNCPEEVELAELLCEIHPWAEKVRFSRTGGESMAIAVRIARAYTGKDKVAFCGYHGWHDWYLAANVGTENALGEHLIAGLEPRGVPRALKGTAFPFRYNRLNELRAIVAKHGKSLAAIVMEPIRSDSPTKEFIRGVRSLADETGAVLVVDEVSAGFRLNTGGAHMVIGLKPDIAVFSKAMGNGYPIGAIIGKSRIMEAAQTSFISSTNWTERVGPVAALAMIRKHRTCKVADHICRIGGMVQDGWRKIALKHGLELSVGGLLPLGHFGFKHEKGLALKALFIQLMLERGFLASNLFYAMYAHKDYHVKAYLAACDSAFAEMAGIIKAGKIDASLIGEPARAGFKRLT